MSVFMLDRRGETGIYTQATESVLLTGEAAPRTNLLSAGIADLTTEDTFGAYVQDPNNIDRWAVWLASYDSTTGVVTPSMVECESDPPISDGSIVHVVATITEESLSQFIDQEKPGDTYTWLPMGSTTYWQSPGSTLVPSVSTDDAWESSGGALSINIRNDSPYPADFAPIRLKFDVYLETSAWTDLATAGAIMIKLQSDYAYDMIYDEPDTWDLLYSTLADATGTLALDAWCSLEFELVIPEYSYRVYSFILGHPSISPRIRAKNIMFSVG